MTFKVCSKTKYLFKFLGHGHGHGLKLSNILGMRT